MSNIFTTIPTLNNHPTPNNSHGLPSYLTYWEIILNQQYGNNIRELEKIWGMDGEELIIELLQNLHNNNVLALYSPLTGEILYHFNTTTGKGFISEEL